MRSSNLMIVQGGGPTAVFNATLGASIAEARRQPEVRRILGAVSGVLGLVRGQIADLTELSAGDMDQMGQTPGAALGSSRYSPAPGELDELVATLRRFEVEQLLLIGGNGTMRGAQIVRELCRERGVGVRVVGVPKTIDNDIAATDRCPGYASAARYIACSTQELAADLRSLPQPVTILETMGRSVGWIAAASALARSSESDAPHLICLPEIPFEPEVFLERLEHIVSERGWAVVVVAEGIRNPDGSPVYQVGDPSQADPLKRPLIGNVAQHLALLVGQRLRIRCRSEKPGLLGRACMAHVAARDRLDAVAVAVAGVRALAAGGDGMMVALKPLADSGESGVELVPLAHCAGVERSVPQDWIEDTPLAVSEAFLSYLRPLVGALDPPMKQLRALSRYPGEESR